MIGALLLVLAAAQVPPTTTEYAAYTGLHAAAARGEAAEVARLAKGGADANERDRYRRTPLHVAAYKGRHEEMRALVKAGANPNALEHDRYDVATLRVALEIGCRASNVTSRYDGTALIAAAHLGHDEVVRTLIRAGAPLDHVNNLGWTALIESIVLGDYARLKRDYLPADYRRDAADLGVVQTVHVEAECSREQQVAETEWLTALNAKEGMPNAIVAHAWFHTPEAARILERQASFPLVRGIRSKPLGDGMMREKGWLAGYALLERFKLSWDCRVKTWELDEAAVVVRSHPGIPVVLNHTGFPWDRSPRGLDQWRRGMRALAASSHCYCKLSCLCLPDGPWDYESNRRVLLGAIEIFGVERCMFASNFPVDGLRVTFRRMFDDYKRVAEVFTPAERRALFHDNAARFYRL